jgi:hypothetical protein
VDAQVPATEDDVRVAVAVDVAHRRGGEHAVGHAVGLGPSGATWNASPVAQRQRTLPSRLKTTMPPGWLGSWLEPAPTTISTAPSPSRSATVGPLSTAVGGLPSHHHRTTALPARQRAPVGPHHPQEPVERPDQDLGHPVAVDVGDGGRGGAEAARDLDFPGLGQNGSGARRDRRAEGGDQAEGREQQNRAAPEATRDVQRTVSLEGHKRGLRVKFSSP